MSRYPVLVNRRAILSFLWPTPLAIFFSICFLDVVYSISPSQWSSLQADTAHMFWHGFDGYMKYAYPEDELRPITCGAFTRDFENQNNWELNDPLPDYSLTLIDSLSTLAILASSSESADGRKRAFDRFQKGVQQLVELYGDGTDGPNGRGARMRGFDLDSKVQVFETAIRGVGGLLSAHLFAVGELPILDYDPDKLRGTGWTKVDGIKWSRRFTYNDQLLRLAVNLGERLLPAFNTQTGIPYPRVNLRSGVPFYRNAMQNCEAEPPEDDFGDFLQCPATPQAEDERTETCSAGAGSLVLEFTVLSRLTGDDKFERMAKRAFWAVWDRRMPTGLVGAGIDAETGEWKGSPVTGVGAGIDSFYEYAAKSYILLSGSSSGPRRALNDSVTALFEPTPLSEMQDSSDGFLYAWQESQQAIRRHVYSADNVVHPYYAQVNLWNAAQAATWVDSLSAFYPGTLAMTGHVEEAEVTHLLYTALWARYSGLPERWSTTSGDIEHGLPWWPGRPEFIESAWYLYRATKDPWYVHVGEMTLRDIKRRCWTPCGWAGIQDVRNGQLTDRMESFFLGETAKYLHLLFDPEHPLNKLDAPWVFTTEGHPLIIPRAKRGSVVRRTVLPAQHSPAIIEAPVCPVPRPPLPLTVSNTAARADLFHAAALARLHLATPAIQRESALLPSSDSNPSISLDDVRSPTNNTFFPWTLPQQLVPPNGTCAPIPETPTFHITFPTPSTLSLNAPNHRTLKGIFMNSLAGVKLSMIQDVSQLSAEDSLASAFRINAINGQAIGRDEHMFIAKDTISTVVTDNDPNFSRIRDPTNLDIVVDIPNAPRTEAPPAASASPTSNATLASLVTSLENMAETLSTDNRDELIGQLAAAGLNEGPFSSALRFLMDKVTSKLSQTPEPKPQVPPATFTRRYLQAITASGPGAAPLPDVPDAPPLDPSTDAVNGDLLWDNIYVGGQLCDTPLPAAISRTHSVLILQRGGCSFSDKLANIPAFPPSKESLKLVIVVNYPDGRTVEDERQVGVQDEGITQEKLDQGQFLFRPLLDKPQVTNGGVARRNPIPMVMIGGGDEVYDTMAQATKLGVKRKYRVVAQGWPIRNLHVL